MELQGKVAAILSEKEIILNRGTAHGVKPGMKFAILGSVEEIKDPDTGELLDTIHLAKGLVQAREVREKIAICDQVACSGKLFNLSFPINRAIFASQSLSLVLSETSCVRRGDSVKLV